MVCGFCGTDIKLGFETCSPCGATYEKTFSCLGMLISVGMLLVGFLLTIEALFEKYNHDGLTLGILLLALGGWGSIRLFKAGRSYKWVRKQ
jgi:hypothetical protein